MPQAIEQLADAGQPRLLGMGSGRGKIVSVREEGREPCSFLQVCSWLSSGPRTQTNSSSFALRPAWNQTTTSKQPNRKKRGAAEVPRRVGCAFFVHGGIGAPQVQARLSLHSAALLRMRQSRVYITQITSIAIKKS